MDKGIPIERLPYINFEDERLAGLGAQHLQIMVEEYYRLFPEARGREVVSWFLDEVHVVPGWERFVRRLLDTEKVEVFVSGSSAALLSREVATSMRGRGWEVTIFPFGFDEFLRYHSREIPKRLHRLSRTERSYLEGALLEYLETGGFPEVQCIEPMDRVTLLRQYVDVVMLRDVMERHRVSNVAALRYLVRHLLRNPGGLFSVEKLYRDIKSQAIAISRDTLYHMVSFLEDAFLVRVSWLDSASERRRMVNPRKVYPVDPGMIPAFDRTGCFSRGHALETAVRIELERRRMEVSYVRTPDGYEVDFIARWPGESPQLIQVCAELDDPQTRSRETRALLEAAKEFPDASLHLVTLTPEAAHEVPKTIKVHSAAIWLLEDFHTC